MRRSETRSSPPYAPLLQMAYGALSTQILCVAAQLGLPDRLAQDGPISAAELAPKIGVDALTVERVLRALVRRQLTPGPISSLPGTAGLPPFRE